MTTQINAWSDVSSIARTVQDSMLGGTDRALGLVFGLVRGAFLVILAYILGGMVLLGIQPGPSMVGADLNITYSVIWSLALANVMGAGICLALAIPISRLTQIPFQRLAPFMIVLICFAAFQATRSLADLVALVGKSL